MNAESAHHEEPATSSAEFHRGGGTVVLVTHGEAVNAHADRTLSLEQGRLVAN